MKIMAINAGSSSLKFKLYEMPDTTVICAGNFERIGLANSFYTINYNGQTYKQELVLNNHEDAVNSLVKILITMKIINQIDEIEGIGHRVVHSGPKYTDSVIIDEQVIANLNEISSLAPLHNPANIIAIMAFKNILPQIKVIAVFDTTFHQTMPKEFFLYPVPYEWYQNYGIRKYGFQGTSHKYIAYRLSQILNNDKLKIISCHLGNGSSICAIDKMKSIDTTMGFTPLAGLPMGTRSGDIDSSIIPYVMQKSNKTIDEVMTDLNKASGFLGVSGLSADVRDIEAGIEAGNEHCKLAYDIFINKVVSYIASYYVLLGGADVICFTAGIGERGIEARKNIIDKLAPLGIYIDEAKNNIKSQEALISREDSKVLCYVIPTDEEFMIAQATYQLMRDDV